MQHRIRDALRRGAIDEASVLAAQWAAAEPHDADAQHLLAVALAQAGAFDQALEAVAVSIRLAPERADLHLLRATLLTRTHQIDEAQAALASSLGLDPNMFPAYLAKARLALLRGDVAEAEALSRTAARIAPDDPQLILTDATIALHRGDPDRVLALATSVIDPLGDEPQLWSLLASAYAARQHWAFAEQAFRRLAAVMPGGNAVQPAIARMVQQQGRPLEAVAILEPLLALPDVDAVVVRRMLASCQLQAGREQQAMPYLLDLLQMVPGDPLVLQSLVSLWRRHDDLDGGRAALDAALGRHAQTAELWSARLALEAQGGTGAAEVVRRWNTAMPDTLPALEAELLVRELAGDQGAMIAVARQIVALEPGRLSGERVLVEHQMETDPERALARVDELSAMQQAASQPLELRNWKGWLLDRIDRRDEALAAWRGIHRQYEAARLALPSFAGLGDGWTEPAVAQGPTRTLLVWGAPGSGIERVVDLLGSVGASVLADRFGPAAPRDAFQWVETPQRLAEGTLQDDVLIAQWREALSARGAADENVIDWIPWWDNAFVPALRAHLPHGRLLSVIRDPRDMLLDWLSAGSPLPLAMASTPAAATWLATALDQLLDLEEVRAYPLTLLRVDDTLADPASLAAQIGEALGVQLPTPAPTPGQRRLPAGRWRAYTAELGEAFALLTPVAVRLGYPET